MLGRGKGSRKYNDVVTLTYAAATRDALGHAAMGEAVAVATIYADVQRMSASKAALTFEQADIIGLDFEYRNPGDVTYNGIRWHGHDVNITAPERLDNRGRIIRAQGWYQQDDPVVAPAPTPDPEEEQAQEG